MRERLIRDAIPDYAAHDRHTSQWVDHEIRCQMTGALVASLRPASVLDPACGDGAVEAAMAALHRPEAMQLNDLATANVARLQVEPWWDACWAATNDDLGQVLMHTGNWTVVVLTEILEHVPDPVWVLREARRRGELLVASSPEMRPGQTDTNHEHLWMFDHEGYGEMLREAGWRPFIETILRFPASYYDFGIWVAR